MNLQLSKLKGVHPGAVLERELRTRGLTKGAFALSIKEYPQTLGEITKGRRNMNTSLALRIEEKLGIEEGFFMTLQVFYDIKQEKKKRDATYHPDLSVFRRALFWDTRIEGIDWRQQKRAVIERVWERGDESEKAEIVWFYGQESVDEVLDKERIQR